MEKLRSATIKYIWLGAILFAGCQADLKTKDWATARLKEVGAIEVVPRWFELRYVENNAIAFGFLQKCLNISAYHLFLRFP